MLLTSCLTTASTATCWPSFQERPNPKSTRLHFALAAIEDKIISALQESLASEGLTDAVVTYMFDGCVIRLHELQRD